MRKTAKHLIKSLLSSFGYELIPLHKHKKHEIGDSQLANFNIHSRSILSKHRMQTAEDVARLNNKYAAPIFGKVKVWTLIEKLAFCIDPTDQRLLNTSQYVHILQVIEAMENDRITDPFWYKAALLHDIGKVLLLTPEQPENIVCMNNPVRPPEGWNGLDNTTMQWNHDEFAYMRLKGHVSDELAWLIRYHSINVEACLPHMSDRDRSYMEQYLLPFRIYDMDSKTPYHRPSLDIEKYRNLIEEVFPEPILF